MGTDGPEERPTAATATPAQDLAGIVRDGVIGAAGGFVGTSLMTVVLLIGQALGAFDVMNFASLAGIIGLDGVFSAAVLEAIGYFIFLGGGMTTWPLLFASLQAYLPGRTEPTRGIVFATVLWIGFTLAFYTGQTGPTLAIYLAVTLFGHWAYGFGLGAVFEYLVTREDTLV